MIFFLKRIPILRKVVDERFLNHRLRSGCFAGIAGGIVADGLLVYRHYVDHVWSWDLLVVLLTIMVVGLALLSWYLIAD